MAQPSLPDYNPGIIEQAAQRLYGKANAALFGSVAFGASIGLAIGAVPLTSLGDAWPIPSSFGIATTLVGGVLGALIGYVIGDARAFGYKLQAQATLSQLHLERNTAATAHALALLTQARAAQPRPAAPAQAQPPRPAAPATLQPPRAVTPPPSVAPPASIAPPATVAPRHSA
jgi:hypothetical protein